MRSDLRNSLHLNDALSKSSPPRWVAAGGQHCKEAVLDLNDRTSNAVPPPIVDQDLLGVSVVQVYNAAVGSLDENIQARNALRPRPEWFALAVVKIVRRDDGPVTGSPRLSVSR